jgi:hypothetical protein
MRYNVINDLIKQYDCKTYLEIGVQNRVNFDKIVCDHKQGVDPVTFSSDVIGVTSDKFFENCRTKTYDIVFIDGLHESEQVERDIVNSWNQGAKVIVLHDCNPSSEITQRVPRVTREWYGDVWRSFVGFRLCYPDIEAYCHNFDCGVGVIICDGEVESGFNTEMSYTDFDLNRKPLLNII